MNATTTANLSPFAVKALELFGDEWTDVPRNLKLISAWHEAREELKAAGLIEEQYGQIRLTQTEEPETTSDCEWGCKPGETSPFCEEFHSFEKPKDKTAENEAFETLVKAPETPSEPVKPVVEPETPSKPAEAVETVSTRAPKDQNEHLWTARRLLDKNALLVAMVANMEMGMRHQAAFVGSQTALSSEYLANATGLAKNTAMKAMNEAVKAGLFTRVDKANGGSNGRNAATYTPTVPA